MKFKKSDYWDLQALCDKSKIEFESRLFSVGGKRIASGKDFDGLTGKLLPEKEGQILVLNEKAAKDLKEKIKTEKWVVTDVEEKPVTRKAPPPFITSTLQQDANRKLGLGAREAMRVAQTLYEQGLITYMRTDSTNLSTQALAAARKAIQKLYGKDYLPAEPRTYQHKNRKGAQEAHEAIRPAGSEFVLPEDSGLKGAEYKLYEMIWMRTMASQMPDSKQKQVSIRFEVGTTVFASSGVTVEFPGFLKAYEEGTDDESDKDKESKLPQLKKGDSVVCKHIDVNQHETKPPARFTEASLIQTMEREGIGRPSTYAPTIATIIDRGYARKGGTALVPTFTAMVVNRMLSQYLPQYVDLAFTSKMEDSLDDIADGDLDSTKYLKEIYFGKTGLKAQVTQKEKEVDPEEARSIKFDTMPGYDVRVGRYGAYVCRLGKKKGEEEVCASLPANQNPADVTPEIADKLIEQKASGANSIGKDPKTDLPIFVLSGRYGPYVQLGDASDKKIKIKRVSIPPTIPMESVDLKKALELLTLPRTLGLHPELKKEIKLGYGRFGPYVVCEKDYRSIPKTEDFLKTTFERALQLLKEPKKGRRGSTPIKILGQHPKGGDIGLYDGKYGPYVKWDKTNVSLPEGKTIDKISLTDALGLLGQKGEKPAKSTKTTKAAKSPKAPKNVDNILKSKEKTKLPKKQPQRARA